MAAAKQFRLQTKNIFLTFPQCDYQLHDFNDKVKDFFGDNLEKYVVCQESHLDGQPHLHAAIALKQKIRTSDVRHFDSLVDPPKHPNIDSKFKGGALKAFQYVMKAGNYLSDLPEFDLQAFISLATKKRATTPSMMISTLSELTPGLSEEAQLDRLLEDYPEYVLQHPSQVTLFLSLRSQKARRDSLAQARQIPVHVRPADSQSNIYNIQIADWLNLRLRNPNSPHRFHQLWVKGGPGIGKTSLIRMMEQAFRLQVYWWSKDELWFDDYSDGQYELIVLDEYRCEKKITHLNPILSNDTVPLSRRGRAPVVKRDILPVIIFSNFTPEEAYHKIAESQPARLAPLLDRLIVVEVPAGGLIRIVPTAPHVEFPLIDPPEEDDEFGSRLYEDTVLEPPTPEPIIFDLAQECSDEDLIDPTIALRRDFHNWIK